ncbi:hypothetical protein D4L85_20045 [Chryseolinea soli]|uniref:Uncharacterized protein n=1 Tax=Chryseolinea soli TaxID=2321403 RepID=A0A385SVC2_9BACT|nr:hypothetical protein D4L85_20045 [Chryseolinea soli]
MLVFFTNKIYGHTLSSGEPNEDGKFSARNNTTHRPIMIGRNDLRLRRWERYACFKNVTGSDSLLVRHQQRGVGAMGNVLFGSIEWHEGFASGMSLKAILVGEEHQ